VAWSEANRADFVEGGAGTPCGTCLFAPESNGGLWIGPDGSWAANEAGCIQLLDPIHGPACAATLNEYNGCEQLACAYCPNFAPNDAAQCFAASGAGACASYSDSAMNLCVEAGDAFYTCTANLNDASQYLYVATLICGSLPADAGGD
jgi:hypothetical protein